MNKLHSYLSKASLICGRGLILLVRLYQLALSPWLGANCRFHPHCSEYAIQAITQQGPGRGLVLTMIRIGKCHPWHPGGYDPVPTARQSK